MFTASTSQIDDPQQRFARAVAESPHDLARLALLLSDEYADDAEATYATLERLGDEVRRRTANQSTIEDKLITLTTYLHDELGLTGDTKTYYDPRNSFISEVLARKKGIPITLAVITMVVAEHAEIPLYGISFPAHFLMGAPNHMFIDPFDPLTLKTERDIRELFVSLGGSAEAFNATKLLAPATPQQIVTRMLTNLKMVYGQTQQLENAVSTIDRLLILNPDAHHEYRDRGALHMQLDLYALAIRDFEQFLDNKPPIEERAAVENAVEALRKRISMLH